MFIRANQARVRNQTGATRFHNPLLAETIILPRFAAQSYISSVSSMSRLSLTKLVASIGKFIAASIGNHGNEKHSYMVLRGALLRMWWEPAILAFKILNFPKLILLPHTYSAITYSVTSKENRLKYACLWQARQYRKYSNANEQTSSSIK